MAARMQTSLVVEIALAGCASSSTPTYLPSDVTFLKPDVPQCVMDNPNAPAMGHFCCQTFDFDSIGDAVKSSGEEGFPGNYELDGDVATGQVFHQDFTFDFSTNIATGAPLVAGAWIADPDNLVAIACL
jgi:hypothetical protein